MSARPQRMLQDSIPQRVHVPGHHCFNFQKLEKPCSLSDLAGDYLLFQSNIQALWKPLSCWPPGLHELPEM